MPLKELPVEAVKGTTPGTVALAWVVGARAAVIAHLLDVVSA